MTNKVCSAPMGIKINGVFVPAALHCVEPKGHAGEHGVYVSWPGDEAVGIILDLNVDPK